MCTAITLNGNNNYFGRNLDLDFSYGEEVIITPAEYEFKFRREKSIRNHKALIGVGIIVNDYPLYFDAINEDGLGMAGLNFPGNAYYDDTLGNDKNNITPFEFIPWILSQCSNVNEARKLVERINLINISFSEQLPLAGLHWLITDREKSIVVEATKEGLHIYDNPIGVLTNNPEFNYQMYNLNKYRSLSISTPQNTFSDSVNLQVDGTGFGGIGLPGDVSPESRFVRAAFSKLNSSKGMTVEEDITQFFHILETVEQIKGVNKTESGHEEYTVYSNCYDLDSKTLYYTTYENRQIVAVTLNKNKKDNKLIAYPFKRVQEINKLN
ncbi:choloylglycine hydrolase [Ligilactobacillus salivarius]|uniref:choloylglycine hydrolase n=1 Tax=Ligilactobacillus salivarius TaxID=1624 RepID=UPI003D04D2ED